ncbi:MAG TPA: HU family DNA-binding protein [Burkholderiales bacterium]|nr:HU family DNA-binding protein [Burkholderiales bacterium]
MHCRHSPKHQQERTAHSTTRPVCPRPGGKGEAFRVQRYRGEQMNKSELVEVVARSAGISKSASEKALDGAIDAIKGALKKGQSVTLVGFGTFRVGRREARAGRNPQTGEEIRIKAARVPKFSAGKALKDAVN